MQKSPTFRIIFDIFTFISVFLLPWWCVLIVAMIGLVLFYNYVEIIFFGFILDSLYAPPIGFSRYIFTVGATLFATLEIFVKNYIRI